MPQRRVFTLYVSLARLGAGFGSAPADIIPNRIPAVSAHFFMEMSPIICYYNSSLAREIR